MKDNEKLDPDFKLSMKALNPIFLEVFPTAGDMTLIVYAEGGNLVMDRIDKEGFKDLTFGENGTLILKTPDDIPFQALVAKQLNEQSILVGGKEGIIQITPQGEVIEGIYPDNWKRFEFALNQRSVIIEDVQLIVEPDDGFLLFGNFRSNRGYKSNIFLARYTKEGNPDINFGQNGLYTLERSRHSDLVHSVLLLSDSAYLLAGSSNAQMMMAKLLVPPTKRQIVTVTPRNPQNPFNSRLFPNPIHGQLIHIYFELEDENRVEISLYSLTGHFLQRLHSGQKSQGIYQESLTLAQNLNPGHYLVRLQTSQADSWHKLVLIP